jgi:glycerol-3-phosphate cytidylyltransferase
MPPREFRTTYGTFDLFHVGHIRLLQRISAMAERLVVGCSTDAFNAIKGKRTVASFEERVETLRACRYVDHVFAERDWHQKPEDIARFGADVFVMGGDWEGRFDDLAAHCTVRYLPRTEGVSSTQLKQRAGRVVLR